MDQIKQNQDLQTTIDLYKIGRVLGRGGFGKVNLGLQRLTRKLVAIKSIKLKEIDDEQQQRKILQEIKIM